MQWWEEYRVVQCSGCKTIAFEKTYRDTETFDNEGGLDEACEVFPNPTERQPMDDFHELPWHIGRMYTETLRAFSGSMNVLTTMGVRALVEGVCNERGCKPAKLYKQIDELVALDVVPQHHADLLHEIRFLGNEAAHELGAVQPKELGEAIDAVEVVLRGVYVIPAVTEKMQDRRAKREAKAKKLRDAN